MAVVARGAIMAVGDLAVDLDWTPEVYDALWDSDNRRPRNLYMLVMQGSTLVYPPFVLRRVDGGEEGLSIGGPGILWALGAGAVGPPLDDREYLSGANKLSNPLDPANPLDPPDLYWITGDSAWVIGAGYATVSSAVELYEDQLLGSDEPWPVVPGAQYTSSVTIGRIAGYSVGRLRLRHHYTGGPFAHADQLPPFSTWGASTGTNLGQHDIVFDSGAGAFRAGPSAMPNLVIDGEFAVGPLGADWGTIGAWGQGTDGGWNGATYAFTDNSGFDLLVSTHPLSVIPGEQYEMRYVVRVNPGSPATEGDLYMQVALSTIAGPPYTRIDSDHFKGPAPTTDWTIFRKFFEVPDAHISMTPLFAVNAPNPGGRFDIDTATLIRTKGNVDFSTSPIFAITPGRSYKWRQPVMVDVGVTEGTVSLAMVCFVATRPVVVLQGPSVQVTGGGNEVIEWEFTPPSGMDVCMARIVCQDVKGGSVWLAQEGAYIRQSDTSSMVLESIGPLTAPVNVALTLLSTAPEGAKEVVVELVAEAYGIGWVASGFELIRVAVYPANGDIIISDILNSPTAGGDPLTIHPGYVTCPETIPHDWSLVNLHPRAAIDHYVSVVSLPTREYRVAATNPPTLDVAERSVLWPDPGPASAFLPDDIDVEEIVAPSTDIADRATEIVVLGNERQLRSGRTRLITASAQVPGPVDLDLYSNPMPRRKYLSDGTIDHIGYAIARAEDLAEQEARPAWAAKVVLSGTDDYGNDRAMLIREGQTVYLYKPDAGIIDEDNDVTINGVEVFPRQGRALEIERDHGPSYRIVMLEPGGGTWGLPGVLFSEDDRTQVTVGDRLPVEWTADPAGGAVGVQYTRDRQSRPR